MQVEAYLPKSKQVNSNINLTGKVLANINFPEKPKEITKFLTNTHGFYNIIYNNGDELIIATDIVESEPVWYANMKGEIFVSTEWEWIKEQLKQDSHYSLTQNYTSIQEFRSSGYITGPRTIYNEIRRVPPATVVTINNGQKKSEKYFDYSYKNDIKDINESDIDEIFRQSLARAAEYADGRPIWVLLSGGLDSRLLLSHLAELDYPDLNALTYGKPTSDDAQVAKQIAESLDVNWEFVEYSSEKWKQWYQSKERKEYFEYLDENNIASLESWGAIYELRERNILSDDAVLMPGIFANMIFGGWVPRILYEQRMISQENVVDYILDQFYSKNEIKEEDHKDEICERIINVSEVKDCKNKDEYIEAAERWNWKSRQARLIINRVRVFDFWELDWWLPYCDIDLVRFWLNVSLSKRFRRELYKSYTLNFYREVSNEKHRVDDTDKTPKSISEKAKKFVKDSRIGPIVQPLYNKYIYENRGKQDLKKEYRNHPFALYGIMSEDTFVNEYDGSTNIISYRSRERLNEIDFWENDK